MQTTVRGEVRFKGIGVHSGRPVTMTVSPASVDYGIWFKRVDVTDRDNLIPAAYDAVTETVLCTKIENGAGVFVSTIEHLMAALAGLGVDNALIEVDGPEIPIMDGSSKPFVAGLLRTGLREQSGDRRGLRILRSVVVEDGERRAELHPADEFSIDFELDYEESAIGRRSKSLTIDAGVFTRELSAARTFARMEDVEALRAIGLGLGGSLDNVVVVDGAKVLNAGGVRYEDEFVRHKMLDAVGDLALAGGPILGRYVGVRAGHEMTNLLLRKLFATPGAWDFVSLDDVKAGALMTAQAAGAGERALLRA